jgi:putative copper resistance protein D
VSDLLILFRAAHLAATALACGTVAFTVLAAEPAFRASGATADGLRRRFLLIVWGALVVSMLSEAFWLVWLSADIYGAPILAVCLHGGVWTVLTDTRFGLITVIRFALAVLLAVLVVWPVLRWLQLGVAAGLIGLLAFVGHAGATPGTAGDIHLASDVGHLLAAGGWVGALPALALLLTHARGRDDAVWQTIDADATRRFSRLGMACVALLLATGIVNSWNLLGGPRDLITTEYGRLIALKVGLFAAMVGIAAANRLYLTARLPAATALRALARNCWAETGLGLCVFVFVGVLGTLSPSGHTHSISTDVPDNAAFVHIHTGEAMAEITITPGRVGAANAHIRLLRDDFSELPVKSVELALEPPGGGTGLSRTAAHLPDGTWQVDGLDLPRPGVWTVKVIIQGEHGSPMVLDSPIEIGR